MKLIMLAGAGATGKTTIAKALAETKGAVVVESPVRKTFADFGLKAEADMGSFPRHIQVDLQHKILENYGASLTQALEDNKDNPNALIVTERSPADYVAYQFFIFGDALTLFKIESGRAKIRTIMHEISIKFPRFEQYIFKFPFPAPFSVDTESSDGWRSDATGKNYLWACALDHELVRISGSSSARQFSFDLQHSSVQDRLKKIIAKTGI